MKAYLFALSFCAGCAAQTPVVDYPLPEHGKPLTQLVEADAKHILGDSFRLGAKGEIWMIDAIRVWTLPDSTRACAGKPGDQIEKLTLYGALYNPPVPGQPECDCHALVPVTVAPMEKGGARFVNRTVTMTAGSGVWQIDFHDVRWSVPGGIDVLFTVRATARTGQSCPTGKTWSLAASPADAEYRLRLFTRDLVPAGFADPESPPHRIHVQVWAHKY